MRGHAAGEKHHPGHVLQTELEDVRGQKLARNNDLPGILVAHNAGEADVDAKRGVSEVEWEFKGDVIRDRPHELIAISKLTWEQLNKDGVDARD